MKLYSYDGPVKMFDTCISNHWEATTHAVSVKKAKSNLAYRYKKEHNLTADAKIELPGKIEVLCDDDVAS